MREILPKLEEFSKRARPEFVILQCGADGKAGDPLGGLTYSSAFHSAVAKLLHEFAHEKCEGRIVGLGGGGYSSENCANAWTRVVRELAGKSR